MKYWEKDMKSQGYGMLLTSTQVDEEAHISDISIVVDLS